MNKGKTVVVVFRLDHLEPVGVPDVLFLEALKENLAAATYGDVNVDFDATVVAADFHTNDFLQARTI